MIQWVQIDSAPPLIIHDWRALPYLDMTVERAQILSGVGNLRSDVDSEIPNLTIAMINRNGEATEAFEAPPIGYGATVYARDGSSTVVQFSGVVQKVSLSEDGASMEIRA